MTPPHFLSNELVHSAAKGSNFTAKIPILWAESFHINLTFVVVKKDNHKVHKEYHIFRLTRYISELYFHFHNIKDSDYGSYEVVMFHPPQHGQQQQHPHIDHLHHTCIFVLEGVGTSNVVIVVASLVSLLVAVAIIAVVACYYQQRRFPFRRMSRDDEQSLNLHDVDGPMNDDVFLPDVAHTSGSSRMVPMTTMGASKTITVQVES